MSVVVRSPVESPLRELCTILREATALGAGFRLRGADVEIDNLDRLPQALGKRLCAYRDAGWLYAYLGGEQYDKQATAIVAQLGVRSIIVDTIDEARQAVRQLIADQRQHHGHLGLDIETAPKPEWGTYPAVRINQSGMISESQPAAPEARDPYTADIATAQIFGGGTSCCFIFRRAALRLLLGSHWLRRQHLIVHNPGFEMKFIDVAMPSYRAPLGRRPKGRVDCSMQAAGLLFGVEDSAFGGRSLANAARQLLKLELVKELATSDWSASELSPAQKAYACTDAVVAWHIWPLLLRELRKEHRDHCGRVWRRVDAYELQRRAIPSVVDMELRGVLLDREEHARQVTDWSRELAEARADYQALTGRAPPSNPNEVREWLARVLSPVQIRMWPRTDRDQLLSTDQRHLKQLINVPSAKPVLEILAKQKLLQSFGPNFQKHINPVTGRIHCVYNLAGTKSGRFSARAPNLQQLPSVRAPLFKHCIVAAPGYQLVACDFSQVELRAAAWITGDRELTRVYQENRDLHAETAAKFAGVPVDAVTDVQRQAAKPVNFGAIYGIGPETLRLNAYADYGIDMTLREAERRLQQFFRTFRQVDEWRHRHYQICKVRGYVVIGTGRVVHAAWEPSGKLRFNQTCNLPIQGACADCLLRAMILAHARLKQSGVRGGLIISLHDELVLEVLEDDAETARELLEQSMIEAFIETFPGAPTIGAATAKIGRTWAEVK